MSDLKGPNDYLEFGKWNVICQRCGFKFKNDQVQKEWTGLIVCIERCLESRHPQEFVRGVPDDEKVPMVSPPPTDQYVSVTYDTSTGIHDYTIPTATNFQNGL